MSGQRLPAANRSYLAAPVRSPRAAHAKAILLLSETGGQLLVGSGNLGIQGFATPGELWHVFRYSDDDHQHSDEFAAVRHLVAGMVRRGWIDLPVAAVLDQVWATAPWLPDAPSEDGQVRHNLDRPLLDALVDEVGWPVEEMTVHAPSHDHDGVGLRTLVERLSPRRLRVLVTPTTSVDPDALIGAVDGSGRLVTCHTFSVDGDTSAYVHAKFVHLVGADRETLLSGSPNLSPVAMLMAAPSGNVELGVLQTRPRHGFGSLYRRLGMSDPVDLRELGLTIQPSAETAERPPEWPVLLYSSVHNGILELVFDRPVDPAAVSIVDSSGTAVECSSWRAENQTLRGALTATAAEMLARGGRVDVSWTAELGAEPITVGASWPYRIAQIMERLRYSTNADVLETAGVLPEEDAELMGFLQQLEQTLVFDPVTVWRTTRPATPVPDDNDEAETLWWDQLDWDRLSRHPRYLAYTPGRLAVGVAPTDIQVILSAIAARLPRQDPAGGAGETAGDDEAELGREAEAGSREFDALSEDELAEEVHRRLSISVRTRRAFGRFVRRYAAALQVPDFVNALGPTVAVSNAVIFNHLITQLLRRQDAIDPNIAVTGLLATWRMLWGTADQPGLLDRLSGEEARVAAALIEDSGMRAGVARAVAVLDGLDEWAADTAAVATVRHLTTAEAFDLSPELLAHTSGRAEPQSILDAWENLATRTDDAGLLDAIRDVIPQATSLRWTTQKMMRRDPSTGRRLEQIVPSLEIAGLVTLTPDTAGRVLCIVALVAPWAGHASDYWRLQFTDSGDSCVWDRRSGDAFAYIDRDVTDMVDLAVRPPDWYARLETLRKDVSVASQVA